MADDETPRYKAALEEIAATADRNRWHPGTKFPTNLAREWHNGFITCAAQHSIIASEALDPELAARSKAEWQAARGTDTEWWQHSGHCGQCGNVASSCECNGTCGCWDDHGAPLEPWKSIGDQLADALAEIERLRHQPPLWQEPTT